MESMEKIKQPVNADHDQPGMEAKKPYVAPTLTKLGTVKQITQGWVGPGGMDTGTLSRFL